MQNAAKPKADSSKSRLAADLMKATANKRAEVARTDAGLEGGDGFSPSGLVYAGGFGGREMLMIDTIARPRALTRLVTATIHLTAITFITLASLYLVLNGLSDL